ncbi:PKD domain-containing protein [bacterium]|nr:PKD domain-containing protein [bacterium]
MASCGGGGGTNPPINQNPVPAVTATPNTGAAPLNVTLDASASADPDGTITAYDWDFDGDGTFEVLNGAAVPAQQTFNLAGTYTIGLRVHDNGGLFAATTVNVTVTGGGALTWQTQTLDNAGDVGEFCSLAIVDGNPAISYYDRTNQNLKYMRAANATGTTWAIGSDVSVTTDADNDGYYTSLAVVDGNPAISFANTTAGDLRYVRAVDATGTDWSMAPVTVEAVAVFETTSLAVVSGRPAIAYDIAGLEVNYEIAVDNQGADWSTASRKIDGAAETGWAPSLALVDGRPTVAFQRVTGGLDSLYFVRAGDATGSGPWQVPAELHSDAASIGVGFHPSLAIIDGNPAVSYEYYIALGNADPYYTRANTTGGDAGSWDAPVPTSLDAAATIDGGGWSSLAVIGGIPQVAFYNYSDDTLMHVRAQNATGSSWLQPEVVDDGNAGANSVGRYASMVGIGGQPAIAYYDSTANDLKFAVLN